MNFLILNLSKFKTIFSQRHIVILFQGGQNRNKSHSGGTEDEEGLHLPGEYHGVVCGVLGEGGRA